MDDNDAAKNNGLIIGTLALIVLSIVLSFWPVLQKIDIRWSNDDNNYCYLVIPIFIYLLWDIRAQRGGKLKAQSSKLKGESGIELKAQSSKSKGENDVETRTHNSKLQAENDGFKFGEFSWNSLGFVPIVAAIFFITIGELASVETLMYIGLWGCVVGTTFLIYGRRIRHLAFPLFILAFMVPLPPFVNRILTFQLKLAASSIATIMLRLSGISVFQDGNIIDLGITQLQVVEACSGLRYLMPLFLLALLIGYFFTKGWWRNSIIVLLVVPLSVFFNALRIWMSGLLTVKGHPELVENFFHDFSGWVIFMIAGAILFGVTRIINRIGKGVGSDLKLKVPKIQRGNRRLGDEERIRDYGIRGKGQGISNKENAEVGWKKPIVLTAITCLLFAASGYALQKIPSATNLPPRLSFQSFPNDIGQWDGRRSYIPQKILDELWADDYVQASFVNPHTRNAIHLLIPFYEWQGTRHTIHAPQSCLLGGGWALIGSHEKMVTVEPGRKIPVMTLRLEKGNAKILGSYFFFQRGRVLTNPWMNKAFLMWDAFTKRRTDGALVRAELVMVPGQSIDDAWAKLEGFITDLWPILPKYVPE